MFVLKLVVILQTKSFFRWTQVDFSRCSSTNDNLVCLTSSQTRHESKHLGKWLIDSVYWSMFRSLCFNSLFSSFQTVFRQKIARVMSADQGLCSSSDQWSVFGPKDGHPTGSDVSWPGLCSSSDQWSVFRPEDGHPTGSEVSWPGWGMEVAGCPTKVSLQIHHTCAVL